MPTGSASKVLKRPANDSSDSRGQTVRVLSQQELIADMRKYGNAASKSRETAIAVLQRAGIADDSGQLSEMYRG